MFHAADLIFRAQAKSSKPKYGVFCFLITEARETTALEMPDREHTFVLKAENEMEYVIQATDDPDMRQWLDSIRICMRCDPESGLPKPGNAEELIASGDDDSHSIQTELIIGNGNQNNCGDVDVPTLLSQVSFAVVLICVHTVSRNWRFSIRGFMVC